MVCSVVFIYYLASWKSTVYDKTYVYPLWGELIGLALGLSSMLAIPGHFIYAYTKAPGSTFKEVNTVSTPFLKCEMEFVRCGLAD